MTHRELVLSTIRHEQPEKTPYTLAFEGGMDEELDRYYGSTEWRLGVQNCMDTVASLDGSGFLTTEGESTTDLFGSHWRLDRRPWHLERPALAEADLSAYAMPSVDRFPMNVVEDVKSRTGEGAGKFSIVSNGWGLFEEAWRIRGFENLLMDGVVNEDFVSELLDRLTALRLDMIARFADIPADAVMFGDDWGEQRGVILGPERWRRYLKPRWGRVYDAVHAQGKYVISHSCGSVVDILDDLVDIGLDVLESVQPEARGMNPFELKKRFGSEITFWGCLGSQSVVQFSSPGEISATIDRLCAEVGLDGGYILAPAKGLQPGTPVENAAAVVEAFGRQNT